eukprot:1141935-Pelagomonas_calceolata.AAC.5
MPPWNASCIKGGYSKTHLLAVSGAWDATKESYSLNTRRNKRPAFSSPPQSWRSKDCLVCVGVGLSVAFLHKIVEADAGKECLPQRHFQRDVTDVFYAPRIAQNYLHTLPGRRMGCCGGGRGMTVRFQHPD